MTDTNFNDEYALLNALGAPVVVAGGDGVVVFANGAFLSLAGRDDVVGGAVERALGVEACHGALPGQGPVRGSIAGIAVDWSISRARNGCLVALGHRTEMSGDVRAGRDGAGGACEGFAGDGSCDCESHLAPRGGAGAVGEVDARVAHDRRTLFAMVSHELRTPTAGVVGMADLLSQTRLTKKQRAYVDALRAGGRHVLYLVEETLDLARLESGAFALNLEPVCLADVVLEPMRLLSPRAQDKGLSLSCVIDPGVPRRVLADDARLRQIVYNLVGNAVKFTETGGVSVTVQCENPGLPHAQIVIGVRDTGPGVPDDHRDRIFDAFAQAGDSLAARAEGAGLGLAISARLAEAMGGTLGHDSEEGAGAVFSAKLGLRALAYQDKRLASALKGLRICVAVPDGVLRDSLARQVASLGGDVRLVGRVEDVVPDMAVDGVLAPYEWSTDLAAAGHQVVCVHEDVGVAAEGGDGFGSLSALSEPGEFADLLVAQLCGVFGSDGAADADPVGRGAMLSLGEEAGRARGRAGRNSGSSSVASSGPSSASASVSRSRRAIGAGLGEKARFDLTVLLVEDDPVNRLLARTHLQHLGVRVTEAVTGPEGLSTANEAAFDVILLDMRLPIMNGDEVCRRVRGGGGPSADAVVLALTADASDGARRACLRAGCHDVLVKPVTVGGLADALDRWTRRGEAAKIRS